MTRRSVMAPVSTAASGKTSWMLNTSGPRWAHATTRPVRPIVSGGDIAITASARRNQPPAPSPAQPASSEKPAKPTARRARLRLSDARERVDATDRPPRLRVPAHSRPPPPRLDGVVDGTTAARRRRAARAHGPPAPRRCASAPGRSARCRARSAARARRSATAAPATPTSQRRGIGGRRRRSAAPEARVVNSAARRWPAAISSSRRPASSSRARTQASTSSGSTRAASPATSGSAARSLQITGVPSAIASSTGAPNPSYSDGNTSASAPATSPSRSASGHPAGAHDACRQAEPPDRRRDVVLDEPAAAEEHERSVGIVPRPGQQVEQEGVVLVGVGNAG